MRPIVQNSDRPPVSNSNEIASIIVKATSAQIAEKVLPNEDVGQVAVKETETGYHVLKVVERTKAGTRPLDEKLRGDIRKKIQAQVYDRESKRLIETLWKRSQPQIWIE